MITIFVHVPRTGGTTFRRLMDAAYKRCIRVGPEFNNRLADAVEPDALAYYGHHHFGLHRHLWCGRGFRFRYLTLLRDPVERLRSQARNRGVSVVELLARWPEQRNMMVRMLGLGGSAGRYHAEALTSADLVRASARLVAYFDYGFTNQLETFARRVLHLDATFSIPRLNAAPVREPEEVPEDAVDLDRVLFASALAAATRRSTR